VRRGESRPARATGGPPGRVRRVRAARGGIQTTMPYDEYTALYFKFVPIYHGTKMAIEDVNTNSPSEAFKNKKDFSRNIEKIVATRVGSVVSCIVYPISLPYDEAGCGNPDVILDSYPFALQGTIEVTIGSVIQEFTTCDFTITDATAFVLKAKHMRTNQLSISYICLYVGATDGVYTDFYYSLT